LGLGKVVEILDSLLQPVSFAPRDSRRPSAFDMAAFRFDVADPVKLAPRKDGAYCKL
jgi:hypothetical protein